MSDETNEIIAELIRCAGSVVGSLEWGDGTRGARIELELAREALEKNIAELEAQLKTTDEIGICTWTAPSEDENDYWSSSCGEAYVFEIDTPTVHGYAYCPHCGRKLVEVVLPEEDTNDD
jgi:hypothetical protein